ncbi:MAG: hypothetical protein JXA78_03090 [Anaerolineales bacterium]|nr:hypothetical protein [Anaerolineales bacterium]
MTDKKLYFVFLWLVSLLVLFVLVIYTYGYLVAAPYMGFRVNSVGAGIREVFVQASPGQALQVEDVIEQIDGQAWANYDSDLGRARFTEYAPGDVMHLQVLRDGRLLKIAWVIPDRMAAALGEQRLVNSWWLAYVFWLCGLLTILMVRPRDERWILLVILYYLIAIWLITGSINYTRIYGSSLVMRVFTWLLVPVALHFHWLFPAPLGVQRPRLKWIGYLLAGGLALAELYQWTPPRFFTYGALLFALGSAALLAAHAIRQKAARRDLLLLALLIVLLVLLVAGFVVLGGIPGYETMTGGGILFTPLFPLAYFLVVARRQVSELGWRINRAISALVFSLLLVVLALLLIALVMQLTHSTEARLAIFLVLLPLIGLLSALLYPRFQRWFERRFLDVSLPAEALAAAYAGSLSASPGLGSLAAMLDADIFPSLLVRQAALLRLADFAEDGAPRRVQPFYSLGVTPAQIPGGKDLRCLLADERLASPDGCGPLYNWVRLALPLVYGEEIIGACLLGRRDPDDLYGPAEIELLRTLMHQTALALVNLDQSALLQALHREDIRRRDEERTRLARDLHDDVLPQMALLRHHVGDAQDFEQAYQAASARVRQVISGLIPVTLEQFGLHIALEELRDDLDERIRAAGQATPVLVFDLESEKLRYPLEVELHLFRIIQGACLNALKHACASNLAIRGGLEAGKIDLTVEDDGVGFDLSQGLDVASLVEGRHYGLLTMHERAALVGAALSIDTAPGEGTRIRVRWQTREDGPGS